MGVGTNLFSDDKKDEIFEFFWFFTSGEGIWPNPNGADFAGSTGWPKSSSVPRALSYFLWLCWLLFNQAFKTQLRDFPSISKSLRLCEKNQIDQEKEHRGGHWLGWAWLEGWGGMFLVWGKREVWGMGNKLIFMCSGATLPFPASQADLEAGFWGD